MSKRRDNKRKVSETLATPSIDLTNKTPNDIALALLACLPDDATFKHKEAKTLLKAFDLAKAELQHRMNTMSRNFQATNRFSAAFALLQQTGFFAHRHLSSHPKLFAKDRSSPTNI
jgi:hypothetical protein